MSHQAKVEEVRKEVENIDNKSSEYSVIKAAR